MTNELELKALMAASGATQDDLAAVMNCSRQMISKTISTPSRYPIKAMQIHKILTEWASANGLAVSRCA